MSDGERVQGATDISRRVPAFLAVGQSIETEVVLRRACVDLHLELVSAETVSTALAVLNARHFDAAVVHLGLPDGDGLELVWQLHGLDPPCCTVLTADGVADALVREAFHAGVVACLRTPIDDELLGHAARRAVEGTRLWRRCLGAEKHRPGPGRRAFPPGLTRRERQVLELLLDGRNTDEMAVALRVSARTVKYHVANLLRKTGASSRIALLARLSRGLVEIDHDVAAR